MPFFYSDQSSYNFTLPYYTLFRRAQDPQVVDLETDILVQAIIRQESSECTVITIAHTIMDSSRVMVLDQGRVKEFDSPTALLADRQSIFFGMAKDAGLAE